MSGNRSCPCGIFVNLRSLLAYLLFLFFSFLFAA